MPVIDARELSKSFGGREIFSSVNFSLSAGESMSIRGESGAGKTTLINILLGYEKADRGKVLYGAETGNGKSRVKAADFLASSVGVVFQFGDLLPHLTAIENVMLPLLYRNIAVNEATQRAREQLTQVGITHADTKSANLSGGERQRVAIARALVIEPTLIIADEPTGSLDEGNRNLIGEILYSTSKQHDCALVVVTHDQEMAKRADRQYLLTSSGLLEASYVL